MKLSICLKEIDSIILKSYSEIITSLHLLLLMCNNIRTGDIGTDKIFRRGFDPGAVIAQSSN